MRRLVVMTIQDVVSHLFAAPWIHPQVPGDGDVPAGTLLILAEGEDNLIMTSMAEREDNLTMTLMAEREDGMWILVWRYEVAVIGEL